MKNKFYYLLQTIIMVAMFSTGFASCGSDDDDDNGATGSESEIVSKLQGTWEFYSGKETVNGMTVTMKKSDLDQMKSMLSQSMGKRVYFWDETLTFSGYQVNNVSYKMNGQQIVMDGMDLLEGFTITIKTLTSTTLVLHEVISMEGIDIVADMEYHRDAVNDDSNTTNPTGNDDDQGQTTTDYIATTKVKKATLKSRSYESDFKDVAKTFYEDYNTRYRFAIIRGNMTIGYNERHGGSWWNSSDSKLCGIKDMGKVSGLSSVSSKSVGGEDNLYTHTYDGLTYTTFYEVEFQPNHGYSVMFTTEDGVKKYMRIYAESYTLDSGHNLESVTIQYQLY